MPHSLREPHIYRIPTDTKDTLVIGPKDTKILRGKDEIRKVNTNVFISNLQPRFDTGLLPAAIRWMSKDMLDVVVERPPRQAQMFFYPGTAREAINKNHDSILVNIPWTVTTMHFGPRHSKCDGIYMFFRSKPLMSMEDILCRAPLPNMYDNSVCMDERFYGEFHKFLTQKNLCLTDMIHFIMNRIWETGFNYNAGAITAPLPKEIKTDNLGDSLHKWSQMEMSDVLRMNWSKGKTLQSHLDTIRNLAEIDGVDLGFSKAVNATS